MFVVTLGEQSGAAKAIGGDEVTQLFRTSTGYKRLDVYVLMNIIQLEMRIRHGKTGDFWGCTNYPACRGTRRISTAIGNHR